MPSQPLQQFTDLAILTAIAVKYLAGFLDLFKSDLTKRNLPLSHHPPGTEDYYRSWIEILQAPETLPDSLREALMAIEALAAPENRSHREMKLSAARAVNPALDPADSPVCLALQLWLLSPYKFSNGEFIV